MDAITEGLRSFAQSSWLIQCFVTGLIALLLYSPLFMGQELRLTSWTNWWRQAISEWQTTAGVLLGGALVGTVWVYMMYFISFSLTSPPSQVLPAYGTRFYAEYRAWLLQNEAAAKYLDWELFQAELLRSLTCTLIMFAVLFTSFAWWRYVGNRLVRVLIGAWALSILLWLRGWHNLHGVYIPSDFALLFAIGAGLVITKSRRLPGIIILLLAASLIVATHTGILPVYEKLPNTAVGAGAVICVPILLLLYLCFVPHGQKEPVVGQLMATLFILVIGSLLWRGAGSKETIARGTDEAFFAEFASQRIETLQKKDVVSVETERDIDDLREKVRRLLHNEKLATVDGEDFFRFVRERLPWRDAVRGVDYFRYLEYPLTYNALQLENGAKVLDIGTGLSVFPEFLAVKNGGRLIVYVTDINLDTKYHSNVIKALGINDERERGEIVLERQDARELTYPNASFDRVSCISVLEHIAGNGDKAAVREIGRVLRPGGLAAITLPYGSGHKDRSPVLAGERRYDEDSLAELVRASGLSETRRIYFGEPICQFHERLYGTSGLTWLGRYCQLTQMHWSPKYLQVLDSHDSQSIKPLGVLVVLKKPME